jgi:hypothetical protein
MKVETGICRCKYDAFIVLSHEKEKISHPTAFISLQPRQRLREQRELRYELSNRKKLIQSTKKR